MRSERGRFLSLMVEEWYNVQKGYKKMNKIVLVYILLVTVCANAVAASVTYGTAYEAMDGVSHGGGYDSGQFKGIDDRVQKWCNENGLYAQCLYLDKLGGQRLITPDVNDTAQKWIQSVYPCFPKYYKTKIVQATDEKGRKVQDRFLKRCERVREIFEYVSTQSVLLGLDGKCLSGLEGAARKFTSSSDWKLLSDKQSKTGVKGVMGLTTTIRKELLPEMEKLLAQVLVRKQELRQEFLKKNPTVNDELVLRAQIAERKQKELEAEEERQKRVEWENEMADEEKRRANRAGRNGVDAQREQDYLDNLDQQAFWRIQKLNKKKKYIDRGGLQWQPSAPATGR